MFEMRLCRIENWHTTHSPPDHNFLRKKLFLGNGCGKKHIIVKVDKTLRQPRNSPQHRFDREGVKRWQHALKTRENLLVCNNPDTCPTSGPKSEVERKLMIS